MTTTKTVTTAASFADQEAATKEKYASQYKFLSGRSQLRVWVKKEKYEEFKTATRKNGTSIEAELVFRFVC